MKPEDKIRRLIQETRDLRFAHRAAKNYVDAAACAIREVALMDALACLDGQPPRTPFKMPPIKYERIST